MKKRVSFLLMLLLALALAFALSSCGEHEHTAGDPKRENEVAGNCKNVATYDEVCYCTECGEEVSRKTVLTEEYGTHVLSEPTYKNIDTVNCKEGGVRVQILTCTVEGCGNVTEEVVALPSAEHSVKVKTVYDVNPGICENLTSVHKKTVEYCENCSYERVTETTSVTKAASHSYDKGVCTYCSAVNSSASGLEYVLNQDGKSYTLMGIKGDAKPATIRVGYYDGKPVTHIAANAFKGSSVKFVTIGSTVKHIGENAFDGCAIENVNIYDLKAWCEIEFVNDASNPASVSSAFTINGRKLGGVLTLPAGISSVSGYAFANAPIYSVHISNNITKVEENAFYNCALLQNVHIEGEGSKTIEKNAFANCSRITNVFTESLKGWLNVRFEDFTANPVTVASSFYVASELFGKTLEIPAGTVEISDYAFATLGIETVKIPASVKVIGNGAFSGCAALSAVEFADGSVLTDINNGAFLNCGKLATVSIPASVQNIGDSAFENCAALTELKFGASLKTIGNKAFSGCVNVKTLTFANGIEKIGEQAFFGCKELAELKIPDSVEEIGLGAFEGCTSVLKITLPFVGNKFGSSENTNFGYIFGAASVTVKDTDGNDVVIPAYKYNSAYVPVLLKEVVITREKEIYASAFSGCEGIMSVTLPKTVDKIGAYAFEGCTNLSEVYFPSLKAWFEIDFANYLSNPLALAGNLYINGQLLESLSTTFTESEAEVKIDNVKPYAFYGANIKSLVIGDSVMSIGNDAFSGCTELLLVEIKLDKLVTIGARAFNNSKAIETVSINNVDKWSVLNFADAFANPLYYADSLKVNGNIATELTVYSGSVKKYAFAGFEALKKVTFINAASIGESAFAGCTGLSAVNFGATLNVEISADAFKGCSALSAISLLNVKTIGDSAFEGCSAIEAVETAAETIGNSAFKDCTALESLKGNSIKSIGVSAFSGCTSLETATYPATATVGEYAFLGCPLA